MFHERHSRSIVKSLTWLAVAFTVTLLVLLVLEKDWQKAGLHALLIQLFKLIVFYVHERIWNKFNFGQQLKVDKTNKTNVVG